jgi:DNA polymerase III epsilon subunit-like protein
MIMRKRVIPARIKGTVIDIETTGLPQNGAEIITLGAVSGNRLQILQRSDEKNFPARIKRFISRLPRPYYAFNKGFEEAMLGVGIDGELQSEKYEKKSRAIAVAKLRDPFNGNGFDVIATWKKYQETGDPRYLTMIMDHNESDLLLETCLLIVRHSKRREVED